MQTYDPEQAIAYLQTLKSDLQVSPASGTAAIVREIDRASRPYKTRGLTTVNYYVPALLFGWTQILPANSSRRLIVLGGPIAGSIGYAPGPVAAQAIPLMRSKDNEPYVLTEEHWGQWITYDWWATRINIPSDVLVVVEEVYIT